MLSSKNIWSTSHIILSLPGVSKISLYDSFVLKTIWVHQHYVWLKCCCNILRKRDNIRVIAENTWAKRSSHAKLLQRRKVLDVEKKNLEREGRSKSRFGRRLSLERLHVGRSSTTLLKKIAQLPQWHSKHKSKDLLVESINKTNKHITVPSLACRVAMVAGSFVPLWYLATSNPTLNSIVHLTCNHSVILCDLTLSPWWAFLRQYRHHTLSVRNNLRKTGSCYHSQHTSLPV